MDVSRAHLHLHLLFFLAPRTTAHNRFLSPCTYHQFPLEKDVFNFMLFVGNRSFLPRSAVSLKQGHSTSSSKGLCEVVWIIEANLSGDQLLYLTGDPVVLGCWQPENAILMYPTEHANLWKAKVKIPAGISFKYNYLIKETWPSHGIIWRPGPEFSLLVPLMVKQDRNVIVRDSWTKYNTERIPDNAWGSWIEETHLAAQRLTSASTKGKIPYFKPYRADTIPSNVSQNSNASSALTDEHEIVKHHETDLTEPEQFQKDLRVNGKLCLDGNIIDAKNDGTNSVFSERNQPVEEPWSFQPSFLLLISKDRKMPEFPNENNPVEDDETKLEIVNQHFKVKDKPLPAAGSEADNPYSTILLINSSICTMQRIAILEDGKLVELLLEPVKTDVQCDSVYLGVVTKLVPHMGGAFVNIGSSRPSLMDIKPNREPFIFPPFRQRRKKQKTNSSVLGATEEQLALNEKKPAADDAEVIDDVEEFVPQVDLASFMHYDHEEHEIDDDFDVTEVKKNVNGSIVEYSDEVQADFEHFLDGRETNLGGKTVNGSLPVEVEASNNSLMSRPHKKDDKNILTNENKWSQVRKGTKIVVQVVKEGLGTKGPTLTAYPKLKSRFWVLDTRCDRIGVSKKVSGLERTRLKVIAKTLKPPGFGLTVRTVASGHSLEELQKDLEGLLSTWKSILEQAKSAALAADEGVEGSIPVILHRAMGQTLSVVQDYFNEKVKKMVVDSPRTYHEVTNYLQEIAPDLCDRVELYDKRNPIFDEFNIEDEINNILSKKVPLPDGGSLVIEQTEALVSIDVNGGHVMFGHGTSQEKAVLDVNLAAAKQIARELRLRDIGGIIVVDFIGMMDDSHKRLVYEEMKTAVERDRSMVKVSELSRHGLMEITRKRVRPSVTFMISEPCTCCHATGRIEALDTSFSKIEQEICRVLATMDLRADLDNPKTWPRFLLRVDYHMCNYLTSGKRTRLAILSSSLKVWILLKVARGFTRGAFDLKPYTDDKNKDQHQIALSILRRAETRTSNSGRKVTLVPVKKGKVRGK